MIIWHDSKTEPPLKDGTAIPDLVNTRRTHKITKTPW